MTGFVMNAAPVGIMLDEKSKDVLIFSKRVEEEE